MPDPSPSETPTAATTPPGVTGRPTPQQDGWLMDRLRTHDADWEDLRRHHADWMGLHPSDATALYEIAAHDRRDQPLTATRLSERLRLSPSATSALINRLEKSGHIRRTREHEDQRVTTLRASDAAKRRSEDYFGPVTTVLQEMTDTYPPELLDQFDAFLDHLHTTLRTRLAPQPGASPATPPHPTEAP
ncbi:MarR family winged helix-turn-helix transcriptional regulator [Streptomyces luteoverticillatus]|uniref:MarR family winged helix-turn-helix transcriptional regulator n=1 Tax=Streptomyces luteoverticillatus TaxID=66425 RepID=UPI0013E02CCF|nr:helix-turn-helix domain-containing protein [Streptomyces luteoverticillatus]